MATGLKTKQSGNADLDAVFDPYVTGTSPPATGFNVGGTSTDINTRYAPIIYGSSAAATGLNTAQSGNADLNTLFAAYGTASYSLPINGQTYTSFINITSGFGNATIGFKITSGTTWSVYSSNSLGASATLATGSIPVGASTVQFTWGTYVIGDGQTDAGGSITNGASSPTAVSSNPLTYYTTGTNSSTSGSRDREYPFTVDFYNASSANISHSVCTLIGDTEGSI